MPPAIIPLPCALHLTGGTFSLGPRTPIHSDPAALPEAQMLADILQSPHPVSTDMARASAGSITLRLDPHCQSLGSEGYRLTITQGGITLRAAAHAGLFYAVQTLRQMLPPTLDAGEECSVPCIEIEDWPRFAWRGAMLDVSRRFLPVPFVLKFIDLMALHKMNVLQLHLTDDQGWRLEIGKYPRLTTVGAYRTKTLQGRALADPADPSFNPAAERFDNTPHGGFYTQAEARTVVAYAAARHITVVPEIEMPGHAQAAIAAYPFLGCTGQAPEVSPRWGVHDALYKPGPQTWEFLEEVLAEVMDVFPSPYIHIGGDEAIKTQWNNSAECREFMRAHHLADADALQSFFIKHMQRFLSQHGRTLLGWDEILQGGITAGATVMSWRGEAGGVDAARQGHDVVMAPEEFTYFDSYQAADRDAEPLAFHRVVTLPTVYGYEPVPAELTGAQAAHVLGAQCQLWTEYMPTTAQVEYMAFPRLCAFAEIVWTPPQRKDYAGFVTRLPTLLARLDTLQTRYRPLALAPPSPL